MLRTKVSGPMKLYRLGLGAVPKPKAEGTAKCKPLRPGPVVFFSPLTLIVTDTHCIAESQSKARTHLNFTSFCMLIYNSIGGSGSINCLKVLLNNVRYFFVFLTS